MSRKHIQNLINKLTAKEFTRLVFDSKSSNEIAISLECDPNSEDFLRLLKRRIEYLCLNDDHLSYDKPQVSYAGRKVWTIVSDEEFRQTVISSLSNKEIIQKLGLSEKCGYYSSQISQRIRELGIDNTHILENYRKSLSEAGKKGSSKQGFVRKKRSKVWAVSNSDFQRIVSSSKTRTEVFSKLGYTRFSGGVLNNITKRMRLLNIDDTHLKEGAAQAIKQALYRSRENNTIPLEKALVVNSNHHRKGLKQKLLSNNLLENKCSICDLNAVWMEMPLVMVIDHINGINNDNRLENLRLICSNCNSQTSTFGSRNLAHKRSETSDKTSIQDLLRKNKYSGNDLEEALRANGHKRRCHVKKIIYTNGLLSRECSTCHLGEVWQDKPLMLVLDHINGINNDHRLENLRLLCPNCNSQTDTFNGKNCSRASKALKNELMKQLPENPFAADHVVKKLGKRVPLTVEELERRALEKEIRKQEQAKKTQIFHQSRYKHDWQNIDLLGIYERIGSCLGVAKELGDISDNAVRKRLKQLGCQFNERSYIGKKTFKPKHLSGKL